MNPLWLPAIAIAGFWLLWTFFVAVVYLRNLRDAGKLNGATMAFGKLTLAIGWTIDCAVNALVMTVVFFEPPRELTVTARLRRHIRADNWRGRLARRICTAFIEPIDPGHCRG